MSSLAHSHWLKLCQNTDVAACRGSIILLPKEFVKDKTWEIRSLYNKVPIFVLVKIVSTYENEQGYVRLRVKIAIFHLEVENSYMNDMSCS